MPTLQEALARVAIESGRPYHVVERVFLLVQAAADHDVYFMEREGKLIAVGKDGATLPKALEVDVNAAYEDVLALHQKVLDALKG